MQSRIFHKREFFIDIQKSAEPQQVQSSCVLRFPKKALLFSLFDTATWRHWIYVGGAPLRYSEAQGPFLSAKLLFVRIAAANVKLPGYFQRVLSTIFKVMQIIELVDTYVKTSQKASSER